MFAGDRFIEAPEIEKPGLPRLLGGGLERPGAVSADRNFPATLLAGPKGAAGLKVALAPQ